MGLIAIPSLLGFRLSSFWFSGASQPHYLDHGFDDYLDGKSLEKLNETKANNIIDLITKVFEKGDKQSHFDRGNPDYFPIDNEVLNALRKLGHEME